MALRRFRLEIEWAAKVKRMDAAMMNQDFLVILFFALLTQSALAETNCPSSNPDLCRNGALRQVCIANGHLIWLDNLKGVIELDALSPGFEKIKPVGHCACLSLQKSCEDNAEKDCNSKVVECNRMLDWSGQFCLPNKWGGTNCYEH
jgi:hypothetical protein